MFRQLTILAFRWQRLYACRTVFAARKMNESGHKICGVLARVVPSPALRAQTRDERASHSSCVVCGAGSGVPNLEKFQAVKQLKSGSE
jgi:hypothetical protein